MSGWRELPATEAAFERLDRAVVALDGTLRTVEGFAACALPPELARATGSYAGKTIELEALAFRAAHVRYGRVVRVHGPGTWILNAVALPDALVDAPVLALELLAFRGRLHLLVADLFPLTDVDRPALETIAPMFDTFGETGAMTDWTRQILSVRPIFRRMVEGGDLERAASAIGMVSGRWIELLSTAGRVVDVESVARAAARREAYLAAHRLDETVGPFLVRAFGAPLGGRLLSELMFPDRALPPWAALACP